MNIATWLMTPLALLMIVTLTGCPRGTESAQQDQPGTIAEAVSLAELIGQTWHVSRLRLGDAEFTLPINENELPTLTVIDMETVNGFSGVNYWSSNYSEPTPGEISWSGFTTTKMAGYGPEGQLELAFYEALNMTDRVRITSNALELSSADGTTIIAFIRLPDNQM